MTKTPRPSSILLLLTLLWSCCWAFSIQASPQSQPIILDENFSSIDLREVASSVRVSDQIQLSNVQKLSSFNHRLDTHPLASEQSLWLNFSIAHKGNQLEDYSLVIGNPTLDWVDVFVVDERSRILNTYLVGSKRDYSARPINHRMLILPIDMFPEQTHSVFIRIKDDGPLVFALELWRTDDLIATEQIYITLMGIVVGALAMLICYFLITYVFLRNPVRYWYALACASVLLLYLNLTGTIAQLTGFSLYIASMTTFITALVMFCASKVSHSLLESVPGYWRACSYITALLLASSAFFVDSYQQIIAITIFAGITLLLQLGLSLKYHNSQNSLPNRLYALGWLVISVTAFCYLGLYMMGIVLPFVSDILLAGLSLLGIVLLAVAIEAHEQVIIVRQQQQQQGAIENLQRFYDLFRNSAEGLYTSTIDGQLLTINPAMASLFGYENEQQMLQEVPNTSAIYANPQDRDILLGQLFEQGIVLGREIRGKRRDGSEFWFSLSGQIRMDGEETMLYGSIFDLTERKQTSLNLAYLSSHDALTGLLNRQEFDKRLSELLNSTDNHSSESVLLQLNIEKFSVVNDTCGHKAGDTLLKMIAQTISEKIGEKGLIARLNGDNFGILLTDKHAQEARMIATQIIDGCKHVDFEWDTHKFKPVVRVGIAFNAEEISDAEQWMSMCDAACYIAGQKGRYQVHTYSAQDESLQRYESQLKIVSTINKALQADGFSIYYQHYHPLRQAVEGHHYEILLRMHDDADNLIPPATFLPVASRYSLTVDIDKWVIQHYFAWLAGQPTHCDSLQKCNINLSGQSLSDPDFKLFVLNAFEKYAIPYAKICFEIAESMAIINMHDTLAFINRFKELGCSFALDDFGTGFSSYSHLKSLPVDVVKIDGSFIQDILVDNVDLAMVKSIKEIAATMNKATVAEFVESKDVMVELGKIGVDFAQGFGIARPAKLDEFQPYQPHSIE